jgi:hypothetical protein
LVDAPLARRASSPRSFHVKIPPSASFMRTAGLSHGWASGQYQWQSKTADACYLHMSAIVVITLAPPYAYAISAGRVWHISDARLSVDVNAGARGPCHASRADMHEARRHWLLSHDAHVRQWQAKGP